MEQVNIVYFCWCNIKKNYKNIIFGQLDNIVEIGILNIAKIYIEVCCEEDNLIPELTTLFYNKLKDYKYELSFHNENKYEYYGIKKLYDLALLEPNKYFIYLHSKGMFNYSNIDTRHIYEMSLTNGTLHNYKEIIQLFDDNPDIMKAALFPAEHHNNNFCWLNFYWSRGSYLITCKNPIITDNRYYYELWSESGNNLMGNVYNIYENNYKKYKLNEVGNILNMLNGSFRNKINI